jgi:predicted porin
VDATYDPFVASTGIASSMMVHTQAFMANSGAIYPRASNSIGYFTPAGLGGFYGQAMLAFGENPSNAANDDDGKHVGLRLGWGAGQFDISIATGTTQQTPAAATPTAPAQSGDYRASNLGAAYNFGAAKLMFEYSVTKVESYGGVAGRTQDGKGWLIGAIVPMGVGQVRASYSTVKLDVNGTPVGAPGKLALGYTHNLSKRTALYATYAQIRNRDGSALTPGLSAFASTGPNTTSRAYELGMRHVF